MAKGGSRPAWPVPPATPCRCPSPPLPVARRYRRARGPWGMARIGLAAILYVGALVSAFVMGKFDTLRR
jgi:hypothetical protein